uniref:Uncharacterized protein n=1 Tax=Phlebotomus papatasi TaxID=29031 RepID=A0A1B0DGU3_PHLPP
MVKARRGKKELAKDEEVESDVEVQQNAAASSDTEDASRSRKVRKEKKKTVKERASGRNTRDPHPLSVNLSDLAEDKTLDLEDSPEKLIFDPTEITGRSTMLTKGERRMPKKTAASVIEESFEDILATSRCQNVRELSKSCRESLISDGGRQGSNISFHSDDFVSSDN